jgi:hypothetical protein
MNSDIDDDGKLKQRWINKRTNASSENIGFDLSFDQYCQLVREAKLMSSDLGFKGYKFVLARINDSGDYRYDNCRFITQTENATEKKISDKSREASRQNITAYNNSPDKLKGEALSERVILGLKEHTAKRREQAALRRVEYKKTAHKSYLGEKNSQYGTYWVTDGISNRKWKDLLGKIPEGFYKGRTL